VVARDNLNCKNDREGSRNRQEAEADVIAELKIPSRISHLHCPQIKPCEHEHRRGDRKG